MTMLDYDTDVTQNTTPEECAHIVAGSEDVVRGYIEGTPVMALCGHTFVPTKNPERLPICDPCKQIREGLRNHQPD